MTTSSPSAPTTMRLLWTVRALAAVSVLLALMCLALALTWRAKDDDVGCLREALAEGATPAVADIDCGLVSPH